MSQIVQKLPDMKMDNQKSVSNVAMACNDFSKEVAGPPKSIRFYVELIALCAVIIGVWMVFSIPIIFYNLQQDVAIVNDSSFQAPSNSVAMENTVLNCSQHFLLNERTGLCSPVCGEWVEFSHDTVVMFTALTSLMYILHIIGTIIALTLSCYSYKIMFSFPSILLVYYLISPIILDAAFLIRLIGQNALLCSSTDLFESIINSTPFCFLSGTVNSFIFTMMSYWWFFHSVTIFWTVWFPIHARDFKVSGYTKYLHLAIVLISITIPVIPVATSLGTGGYVISVNPPHLNFCYPRSPVAFFYTFTLPFCIVFSIGVTFNLCTLWRLLRMKKLLSKHGISYQAECKLLAFFFYFAFAVGASVNFLAVGAKDAAQNQLGLMDYFACEAFGKDVDDPCVFAVDRRGVQAIAIANYGMYMLGPYATLIFIAPLDKVKAIVLRKYH